MSIEVELANKGGQVCKHAKAANGIKCPLIVRPTSEDVITGSVFGLLKHIRPHLWVGPLLNLGLGTARFRQVWYKDFQIHFWKKVEPFPPELLDFKEGRTEVDVQLSFENPPTTVWIEAKYLSPLAKGTANSDTDQALRGIRTLLAATGHITTPKLFPRPKRNAIWLALLVAKPEPIVDQYRDQPHLMTAIGRPEAITSFPPTPFVGTITWDDVRAVLKTSQSTMIPIERSISLSVDTYLDLKMKQAAVERSGRLMSIGPPPPEQSLPLRIGHMPV